MTWAERQGWHASRSLMDVWIVSFLAMTRSGSGGEAKKEFKEKFSMWESQTSSGLGAQAMADMGEERPLRAVGP